MYWHTLLCMSALAPAFTSSITTSVLPHKAANISAVNPLCVMTDMCSVTHTQILTAHWHLHLLQSVSTPSLHNITYTFIYYMSVTHTVYMYKLTIAVVVVHYSPASSIGKSTKVQTIGLCSICTRWYMCKVPSGSQRVPKTNYFMHVYKYNV